MPDEPQSFIARLKSHHMFRVATVYAIATWVLIQLSNTVFPDLGWPRSSVLILIVAMALGFPLVLILSWMFIPPSRQNPEQFSRWQKWRWRLGPELTLVILALVTVSGIYLWRVNLHHIHAEKATSLAKSPVTTATPAATSTTTIPSKSIAVLPFKNLSTDKANAYFADGMREEILTRLANLGGLLVISSTSSSRFSSSPADLRTVARKLGVATILEGSVQKAGNQVLVNVQLIDARTDNHLWAESYQRAISNIFGVESEVAQKVAGALETQLTAGEKQQISTPGTTNPQAYDAYLRGRAYESAASAIFSTPKHLKALAAYEQAVKLDPKFALAWARLAYLQLYDYNLAVTSDLVPAKQALDKAIALEPEAGETLLAQGYYYYYGLHDYQRALAVFERALTKLPNSAAVLSAIGFVERRQGRWNEALHHINQAVARDPMNALLLAAAGNTYASLREFPAAISLYDRAIAVHPNNQFDIANKASVYQSEGNLAVAGKLLEGIDFASADMDTRLTCVQQKLYLRDYQGAIRLLRMALAKPSHTVPFEKALYNMYLGLAAQWAGNSRTAHTALLEAQSEAKTLLKAMPDNPYLISVLSGIETGLGNKTAAYNDGKRAMALLPASKDAFFGPEFEEHMAMIEARFGEHTTAIVTLRHLLSIPYIGSITVPELRLDPAWDPLRKDPAFQALLVQHPVSPAESAMTTARQ